LKQHIEKGLDFLGYYFSPHGLRIANITWSKFVARLYRLYEQKKASADFDAVLGEYVRRWTQWANAGLDVIEPIKSSPPLENPTVGMLLFVCWMVS
jgi:hypothetical protein